MRTDFAATINQLLIQQDGRKHYNWIKKMIKLYSKDISYHEHQVKICCRCM